MDILGGAVRMATKSADAVTSTAGAIGGAVVGGVLGSARGSFDGVQNGLRAGSHSTPAAVATLAAVGALGLVEWPVLLAVGGTALVLHQLQPREETEPSTAAEPATSRPRRRTTTSPRKKSPSGTAE